MVSPARQAFNDFVASTLPSASKLKAAALRTMFTRLATYAERAGTANFIIAEDFGMGLDVADNSQPLMDAMAFAAANKGRKILCQDGIYNFTGAHKDRGVNGSNAQVVLPKNSDGTQMYTVVIEGGTPPALTWSSVSGTIFQSNSNEDGCCFIGVKNHKTPETNNVKDDISWISPYFKSITIRLPENTKSTALDLGNVPYVSFNYVRVDVPNAVRMKSDYQPYWNMQEPTWASSYGIITPRNDNPVRSDLMYTTVVGYYTGIKANELFDALKTTLCACKVAVELPVMRHPGYARFGIYNCATKVRFTGTATQDLPGASVDLYLDIEHNTPGGGGSGPDWISNIYDIDDPNNLGRGRIVYHMHDTSIPWAVNGGTNLYISELENPLINNPGSGVDPRIPYYDDPNRLYSSSPAWSTDGPDPVWSSPDQKGATNAAIGAYYSGTFTGVGIDIVTPVGPAYGSADVYVDNIKVATVSATAATKGASQVLPVISGSLRGFTSGQHSYKVVNIGGGTADFLLSDRIDGKG